MTVDAYSEGRVQIAGNGVTASVATPFTFVDQNNIKVVHTDAAGVDTEWVYQMSPGSWAYTGGNLSTGTITFTAGDLATGETLTVLLVDDVDQPYDLDNSEVDPIQLQSTVDHLAITAQAQEEKIGRALRMKETTTAATPTVPEPSAGKLIGWNGAGDDLENKSVSDGVETLPTTASRYLKRNAAGTAFEAKTVAEVRADILTSGSVTADASAYIYDTVADVQAATISGAGSSVKFILTSGYTSAGDGGSGLYAYSASEPSHAGKVQSADGAWWEISGLYPNVKQFGAAGDGSTDDATALQNAIDYAEANAPCTMFMPSGRFITSSTLVIDASNVGLAGAGAHQSFILGNFAVGDIILIGNGSTERVGITLSNFTIDSTVSKTSGAGLKITKAHRGEIKSVWMAGQDGEGGADGNLYDGYYLEGADQWQIFDVGAATQRHCVFATATATTILANVTITGGKIVSSGGYGVVAGGGVGGFKLIELDINNCFSGAVVINQSGVAQGNRQVNIENCALDGESIGGVRQQPGLVINDPNLENLFLENTWFSVNTYGIDIQNCSSSLTRIHINGGRIGQCDDDGILIASEPRLLLVSGCDFSDCSGWGINATVTLTGNGQGEGVFIYPNNRFRNNSSGDVDYADIPVLPGSSFTISLNDDEAYSFTPRDQTTIGSNGAILVTEGASNNRADFFYRASTAANIQAWDATNSVSGFTLATGALTGTTGTDGNQTISTHTDKKVYVENRSGEPKTFCITLHAAYPQMKGN